MGQTQGRFLRDISNLEAELGAVADRPFNFSAGIAGNDADFLDPSSRNRLEPIKQYRLIGYRYELLR